MDENKEEETCNRATCTNYKLKNSNNKNKNDEECDNSVCPFRNAAPRCSKQQPEQQQSTQRRSKGSEQEGTVAQNGAQQQMRKSCSASCEAACATNKNSTQILFVEPNFMETPSEYDVFYDCFSECEVQQEEPSVVTSCNASRVSTPKVIGNLQDARVFRSTLKQILCTTHKLLKSFDGAYRKERRSRHSMVDASTTSALPMEMSDEKTRTVQLEINARMNNGGDNAANHLQLDSYRIRVEPVTLSIPLKIQMQSPNGGTMSNTQLTAQMLPSLCRLAATTTYTKTTIMEPIRTSIITAGRPLSPIEVPTEHKPPQDIDTGEKHTPITECQVPCLCMITSTANEPAPSEAAMKDCDEKRSSMKEKESKMQCAICVKSLAATKLPPPKTYRLALPQHKYLRICAPCRFHPSPLIDENGRVFCPGNCGCCLCPWKPRASESFEDRLKHSNLKVCKCRDKGTIFTNFDRPTRNCSNESYFDVCPCREMAEAKYLELYGHEMWNPDESVLAELRGPNVKLEDVVEIRPAKKHNV